MGQLARGNGLAAARPPGDAWSRIRREIDEVAGQPRQWPLERVRDLLRHHAGQSLNPANVPAGQHVQMLFRLGASPGALPATARRDPALDG